MPQTAPSTDVDLSHTSDGGYRPGRPFATRALWLAVETMVFLNPLVTSYRLKRCLLKAFGATIGVGMIIKPNVHIKYPWRFKAGNHVWLGERSWIDSMEDVTLGNSVCVSQGAYLCTGNHDWADPGMRLAPRPIVIEPGAWIGAFACVAPGITVGREAVLTLGSVLQQDADPGGIYSGNPATRTGTRQLRTSRADSQKGVLNS